MTQQPAPRAHSSALFVFLLSVESLLALYLALLVFTRVDEFFLPGNELNVGVLDKVPGVERADGTGKPERINILLLGVDRRPQDGNEPTRTDTILVATLETRSKTGAILSIPRDLYVFIPLDGDDGFMDRINTAYVWGDFYDYPGGGIALLKETVARNLGIKIDYHVIIDFTSFERVIDDLGGIDIEAEREIYYPNYSTDDLHGRELYIPAGFQHMDGYTALAYARFRGDEEGDLGRIRRQQQVMTAAAEKGFSLGWLDRAPGLWNSYNDAIMTDISAAQILGYAVLAKQVDLATVEHRSLGEVVNGEYAVENRFTEDGKAVLWPNWDAIDTIIRQVFLDPRLKQEAAVIEVQNGGTSPLLVDQAVDYLIWQGLPEDAVRPGDEAVGQPGTTIYVSNGKNLTARAIARWLGVPEDRVVERAGGPPGADIVVVLGDDVQLPEAAS